MAGTAGRKPGTDAIMSAAHAGIGELEFDLEALRRKYREERDKRHRDEGIEQYVEVKGDFSHYIDDPYADADFKRTPLNEDLEVLIIGGGLSGLSAGAHLRMAGLGGFRIIEKGGDFGGTWYWNRYPGVQCDIESYCYMPLLEETGYVPTLKYAFGSEILAHAQRIGRKFDLYDGALFQTQVTDMRWNEDLLRWVIKTDRGDELRARFVIKTNSALDRPKLPGIPGIDKFKGHTFHTSRWDYDYTGGDASGGLTKLADKRVAVIGTGATAIQCVPFLGKHAKHLYVFQRTPSGVDERRNKPSDPDWVASLTPGWQKRRRMNFVKLTSGIPQDEDLVNDGWTDAVRSIGGFFQTKSGDVSPEMVQTAMEVADHRKMNQVRARVDEIVKDKATAEALKPWYRQFCKRPTFNDDYLPTFNRPNVTLVDTRGRGVDEITEKGLVFDGKEYEVDCIIFATGFEVATGYAQRSGFEIHGAGGRTLGQEWANGLKSLHGFYTHNFPNLFHMGINQNGVSYSVTFHTDHQAAHIAEMLKEAQMRQVRRIEPTEQAQSAWIKVIRSRSSDNVEFFKQCTPGYYNNEGDEAKGVGIIGETYGGGPIEFFDLLSEWRRTGTMEGLELK